MGYGTYGSGQSMFGTSDTDMGQGDEAFSSSTPLTEEQLKEQKRQTEESARLWKEQIYAKLKSDNGLERGQAAVTIAESYGDKEVIPLLVEYLTWEHESQKVSAILKGLIKLDEKIGLEQSKKYLRTGTNNGIMYECAKLLYGCGDKEGLEFFIGEIKSNKPISEDRMMWVAGAMSSLIDTPTPKGTSKVDLLRPYLNLFIDIANGSRESYQRTKSIKILETICTEDDSIIISALKKASKGWFPFRREYERSKEVRIAAREALENIKTRGIYPKSEDSDGVPYS